MTPERLLSLNRVSAQGISEDGRFVYYSSTQYSIEDNSKTTKYFRIALLGGEPEEVENSVDFLKNSDISIDGKYKISTHEVKIKPTAGNEIYSDLPKADAYIFDDLNYRHWDTWEDGAYSHIFLHKMINGEATDSTDIMPGEPYDCPTKPFGGHEDYTWNHDGTKIIYVTKKSVGSDYATSTNSDIYSYDISTGSTKNLTSNNPGYDTQPQFSSNGVMAWLRMDEAGYEADKNDLIVRIMNNDYNLTANWDGTVNGFLWSDDGTKIYFNAPIDGTVQLFSIDLSSREAKHSSVKQISKGQFDIRGLVGQVGNTMVVSRTDMNHAVELYAVDLKSGKMQQLTHANDELYDKITLSKVEKRMVKTTDGKDMLTWVIYPPDFDPNKRYPTLLYCQGGPQGALSQFYSFRWNFQLMAAQGYIIVAPNRRGMPGHGEEWNRQISGDWGGQNMEDYLAAIDDVVQEPYVDNDRLGCVGASYGGYSVFYLAGIHEGRFKSFIAHDGIFNLRSMYGTTEELFFVNYDFGGPYWDMNNEKAQKSYTEFNPINNVSKWDTPILIFQGGKDYRVPIGQSLEAFQAAQLRGIKSKLVYFPEENHWVLSAQNGLVWQREFYMWLEETLKQNKP
jgi:dipeptidyl aminopeptidase/acylaminoacyl peptidase